MSVKNRNSIVTDGLVFYVDAGNGDSYPGSGTAWSDLVGSNNGTLTNGPTFDSGNGGSIVFDGTNDYISTQLTCGTTFTWSVWFKTDVVSSGYRNIIAIPSPDYMLMLLDGNTTSMGFWTPDGLGGGSLNMDSISANTWYNAVFVREGNSITNGYKTYLNGVFKGQANTGTWSSSDYVWLGGRSGISQYLNGNIACAMVYNKALTAAEVPQNYNALKNRFI